jgi:type II secretory pathway pseudopilin PulG
MAMPPRIAGAIIGAILIAVAGPSWSQEPQGVPELKKLQASLSVINSELRSDLDQILILQEAIRANARTPLAAQANSPDPVSYEDVAAARRRANLRETAINARLDALLARSAELDARKQPLLERVRELGTAP